MRLSSSTYIPFPKASNFKNLLNRRFSELVVIGYGGVENRLTKWICLCDCGQIKSLPAARLQNGDCKTCGCGRRKRIAEASRTHGLSGTLAYSSWKEMHRRCHNRGTKMYKHYGARGITVCSRWHSPENFIADMGERTKDLSLDRIDNDLGYWCGKCIECQTRNQPSNCRWATRTQQNQNFRRNKTLTLNGETKCLSEWARLVDMNRATLQHRYRSGWTTEAILTVPVKTKSRI